MKLNLLDTTYKKMKLVNKLRLIIISIFLISTISIIFINNHISSKSVLKKSYQNSIQRGYLISKNIENFLKYADELSTIIIPNHNIQNMLRDINLFEDIEQYKSYYELQAILDSFIQRKTTISSAIIYKNQIPIIATSQLNVSKIPHLTPEIYETTKSQLNKPTWYYQKSISYEKDHSNINYISMNRVIVNPHNGRIHGILQINIDENNLTQLYNNIFDKHYESFFILDDNGIILSALDKSILYQDITHEEYYSDLVNDTSSDNQYMINNQKYIITKTSIPMVNWSVIGLVPIDTLFKDSKKVTRIIFLTGIIGILLSYIALSYSTKAIINPLMLLSKNMDIVAKGDLSIRMPIVAYDEIGHLTDSFNTMLIKINNLMEQVYNEQQQKKEYELSALQSQINPHFLYNTLESITSLIQLNRNDDAILVVKALAKFYRTTISNGKTIITIKEELSNIENYLIIQNIRYQHKLAYTIDIDDNILDNKIIKLSLQPIVENSIYHGIRPLKKLGHIHIIGKKYSKGIIISIIDNGIGIDPNKINILKKSKGNPTSFGLWSVDQRIKLYFGSIYGVKIQNVFQGTHIDILLPLEEGALDD
ncbi:MAG: histidine kinase [Vallitalea sp.]|nr:histidine kinase [Vallitalea sp.]